ncbi:E3 ubiquitin-protein ligase CHFR-like [Protopterus annectens]|uniref:E3 ubiquitin-protein ligase CHFR-like n=1 Tax=Protopterus annectens TaxID=7888 RepID=UPI001CFA122E|nr:E3 ubiquitin-protein ligase CHFR-like [Protopterus annectens]
MEPTAEKPKAWGKLTLIGGACIESKIFLVNREWTVGRKNGCDLSLPSNKLVSGNHCKIIADQTSGQVWLEDTSTNGTVINKSKVVKKQTYPLQSGDVIYIVYRKNEPENIFYRVECHLFAMEKEGVSNGMAVYLEASSVWVALAGNEVLLLLLEYMLSFCRQSYCQGSGSRFLPQLCSGISSIGSLSAWDNYRGLDRI